MLEVSRFPTSMKTYSRVLGLWQVQQQCSAQQGGKQEQRFRLVATQDNSLAEAVLPWIVRVCFHKGQAKKRLGCPWKAFSMHAGPSCFTSPWGRALPEVYECSHFILNQPCKAYTPLHVPANNPLPNLPDYTVVNQEHGCVCIKEWPLQCQTNWYSQLWQNINGQPYTSCSFFHHIHLVKVYTGYDLCAVWFD